MAPPDAEQKPPNINMIPATIEYLRHYVIDTAYIAPQERAESSKASKRRIYNNTRSVRKVSDRIFLCEHLMDYNLARLHEPTLNLSAHA